MAKPKVFLSSTFYDLKYVRADLERFVRELGYEPILNEKGSIAYGKDESLEEYCYKEINNVDILVSIIGGRFGSESSRGTQSVSQIELKTALDLNKQVYIFIDKNLFSEYRMYLANKGNENLNFDVADDIKIHQFIEFVESLPINNTIHGFETSSDIIQFLKAQWSGLFQRFLQQQTRIKEVNIIKDVQNTAKTLNELVTFLTEEKRDSDVAINQILMNSHPAMSEIQKILKSPFRVYFTNKRELDQLLKHFDYEKFFHPDTSKPGYIEYALNAHNDTVYITINSSIFNEEEKLKAFTKDEWSSDFITYEFASDSFEDIDLPF